MLAVASALIIERLITGQWSPEHSAKVGFPCVTRWQLPVIGSHRLRDSLLTAPDLSPDPLGGPSEYHWQGVAQLQANGLIFQS